MHILFIGGTHFVGRAIAEAALERNHKITLLHRNPTTDPAFGDVEHVLLDRNGDLSSLSNRSFDATIDVCAYVPSQVKRVAAALGGRGGHHVFISTMSVFAEADGPGIDEQSPLVTLDDPTTEEVTGETYGGLKVLCEQAAAAAYGDALTVIRPTYVIGPHDHTGRFTWCTPDRVRWGGAGAGSAGCTDSGGRRTRPGRVDDQAPRRRHDWHLQQRDTHAAVRLR